MGSISLDLYVTWEALDSSELIDFDVGVFLAILAIHSEKLASFSTFLSRLGYRVVILHASEPCESVQRI